MTSHNPAETVRSRIGIKTLREFVAEAKKRGCSLGDCVRPSRAFRHTEDGEFSPRLACVPIEDVLLERITELAAALHEARQWRDGAVELPQGHATVVVREKGQRFIATVFHYEVSPDMEWRTFDSFNAPLDPCLVDTPPDAARDARPRFLDPVDRTHLVVHPPAKPWHELLPEERPND